jgi:hypothetical protein
MSRQLALPLEDRGEARTAMSGHGSSGTDRRMERVAERGTVTVAVKCVLQHKGSPGVDGMTVDELPMYWEEHGEAIRAQLLAGLYQPKPVRAAEIPESGGGVWRTWTWRQASTASTTTC